ncbi:phosphotransacetylase [Clostridia bacterium]|nr:phosphotransacetylase [Clostridia bacterium]
MSKLMDQIRAKAAAAYKHIVLPEGEEPRIIEAAVTVAKEKIAHLTLLGDEKIIRERAKLPDGIEVVNPKTSPLRAEYAELLYNLRKDKGLDKAQAEKLVLDPLYFGVLTVKSGRADGMVGGIIHSTGDLLRPALQVIKTAPGISTVSSCFIMVLPEGSAAASLYGDKGVLVFGDCAVNPNPTAEQLAAIAIASAQSAKSIAGIAPRVAMLSFSTKGSAKHELADKVIAATEIVKKLRPDLEADGELQADAALVEKVGRLKAPASRVAGRANVLIFPDLQAGNIGYKLVQRLADAEAVGPICQGFNSPVNDLSRGASSDDVVSVVAITAVQAI